MPCSLIFLVHIMLTTINTMALAIINSSHLTRIGLHGSIVMWGTLIMRCYKSMIGRVSRLLIPVPIGLIVLSILRSIRLSMRMSIVRDMGNSLRWTIRQSINRDMTFRHNRRHLTLRYYHASSRSTNMASSDIPARRTT